MLRGLAVTSAGFVGATALLGGLELVTGWPRQQPVAWLADTPFDDYVVPGILLATLVGGTATAAAVAAARRSPLWPELAGAAGCVLAGWVVTEIAVLDQPEAPTPTELVYLTLGAGMVATAAAARARTRHLDETPAAGRTDARTRHRHAPS